VPTAEIDLTTVDSHFPDAETLLQAAETVGCSAALRKSALICGAGWCAMTGAL